jgi:hypothetical protein
MTDKREELTLLSFTSFFTFTVGDEQKKKSKSRVDSFVYYNSGSRHTHHSPGAHFGVARILDMQAFPGTFISEECILAMKRNAMEERDIRDRSSHIQHTNMSVVWFPSKSCAVMPATISIL